jgi:hypothetical protein
MSKINELHVGGRFRRYVRDPGSKFITMVSEHPVELCRVYDETIRLNWLKG